MAGMDRDGFPEHGVSEQGDRSLFDRMPGTPVHAPARTAARMPAQTPARTVAPASRPGAPKLHVEAQSSPPAPEPIDAKGRLPSYIRDHRSRLRERFVSGGPEAVPDYELLELVLFRAIPRQDVKPLARRLIERFGSFAAVMTAPPARLAEVHGIGAAVVTEIKIVEAAAARLARGRVMQRPVMSSWDAVLAYLRCAMSHSGTERFRVLFLDRRNALIADEVQGSGTVDHVPVYPREVMKRALELGASALILAHNHPSGDPTPSAADIEMTLRIETAARALDLALHDHIVVGDGREVSMRAEGYI